MVHKRLEALGNPLAEALPDLEGTGVRIKRFEKECVDFHWHFHREIELVYVERGSGVRYVGTAMEPFGDGDLCLIGSNIPHAFGSIPSQRSGAEWLVGHFWPEDWGEGFWRLPENRRIVTLLSRSRHGICFSGRPDRALEERLTCLGKLDGVAKLAAWLELLDRLAHSRSARLMNAEPVVEATSNVRLQTLLTFVEENAAEGAILQSEAARLCGMSPQAFCRFFLQSTGRVFSRYVNEVRVARAAGALLHTESSISEIAFAVGFGNLGNFNRRFREIAGVTPREYRASRGGLSRLPPAS
jgi:AraC-like DNA-binding protein